MYNPTMNDSSTQISGEGAEKLDMKLVSADSHIVEPPHCYIDHIDPEWRDRAPRIQRTESGADYFEVPGMPKKITLGLTAAAGIRPDALSFDQVTFDQLHRGGWDGKARIADQDRDGIIAEIIYPSVGMVLCNHPDAAYKAACFKAYNRWLEEFVAGAPGRLFGLGQTAVTSIEETIRDLEAISARGFVGVMLPGMPATEFDYDDERFDPVWQACVDLKLPICFHVLTGGSNPAAKFGVDTRGTKVAHSSHVTIRLNQDLTALFIWGRVFERFPGLKMVCTEADAGWAPHFMYRMDHFYSRHRYWSKTEEMARMPSEYFRENIYLTFQDDWSAFRQVRDLNPQRLLWANDFPHSDSTWPVSREMLKVHTAELTEQQKRWILHDNTVELFGLELAQ
jgi:predicted TIM-barrel fold metal-dependent hydrolase